MNDELKRYLDDPFLIRKVQVSKDEDIELILAIYMGIKATLKDGCSIIEVRDNELILKRRMDGPPIRRLPFPMGRLLVPSTMRQYFNSILSRDVILRSSLELIHETDDSIVYRIL
jgi:hypothetical protein